MTVSLDGYTAIDVYRARIFPLNDDGTFYVKTEDASGGVQTLYEGVEILAPTGLEFSLGEPRTIPVVAQGQTKTTFSLPSTDAKTATLRAAYEQLSTDAELTKTKIDTLAAMKAMGIDNDKSGLERLCAFYISQLQAHDDSGNHIWASTFLHRVTLKPNRPSFTENQLEKEFAMSLSRSKKRAWGEPYSDSTHGRTEDVGDVILSTGKFSCGLWMGNNDYTSFDLPSDKLALTSAGARVWDVAAGTERAGTWDASTDAGTFTPSAKPADGTILFVVYEY